MATRPLQELESLLGDLETRLAVAEEQLAAAALDKSRLEELAQQLVDQLSTKEKETGGLEQRLAELEAQLASEVERHREAEQQLAQEAGEAGEAASRLRLLMGAHQRIPSRGIRPGVSDMRAATLVEPQARWMLRRPSCSPGCRRRRRRRRRQRLPGSRRSSAAWMRWRPWRATRARCIDYGRLWRTSIRTGIARRQGVISGAHTRAPAGDDPGQCPSLQAQLELLGSQLVGAQEAAVTGRAEADALRGRVAALEASLRRSQQAAEELQQEAAALARQISAREAAIHELEGRATGLKEEASALQEDLASLAAAHQVANDNLVKTCAEREDLASRCRAAETGLVHLEQIVAARASAPSARRVPRSTCSSDTCDAPLQDRELSELVAAHGALEREYRRQQGDLAQAQRMSSSRQAALDLQQQRVEALEASIAALQGENQGMLADIQVGCVL